jgi:chromosome segregation ATPase
MCKKFAITAMAVAGILAALSFTKLGSYANLAWKKVQNAAAQSVPIEVEIERLKEEAKKLQPDLDKNIALVANEMARVKKMESDITTTRANLSEQKANLVQFANWVESGETQFIKGGKVFTKDQIAERMDRDWKSYQRAEKDVVYREKELAIRKKTLNSATEQLTAMQDKERELKEAINLLESELKAVRVEQTRSNFALDDSRLSDIKQSIADLRVRVDAERYAVELKGQFANTGGQNVEQTEIKPVKNLAKEIKEALEGSAVANEK